MLIHHVIAVRFCPSFIVMHVGKDAVDSYLSVRFVAFCNFMQPSAVVGKKVRNSLELTCTGKTDIWGRGEYSMDFE